MNKRALLAATLTLLVTVAAVSGGTAVAIDSAAASVNASGETPTNATTENTTNTTQSDPSGPIREAPGAQADQIPENIGPDLHTSLSSDLTGSKGGQATQQAVAGGEGLFVTVVPAGGPGQAAKAVGEYGSVSQIVNGEVEAIIPRDRVSPLANDARVEKVRYPKLTEQMDLLNGTKTIGGQYLRDVNKTGDTVRVAVIDHAFDPAHEPIADNVVETVAYTNGGIDGSGDTTHGDATAEIVTNVAPNVELVLYSARSLNQNVEAANNISQRDDIDVVSMSLGVQGGGVPLDGSDEWSQAVSSSVNNGTVWAVSAGNSGQGQKHYSLEYDNSQFTDRHTFGARYTPADLTAVSPQNDEISGVVQWNEWPNRTNEFTVALYEDANSNGTYTAATDLQGNQHIAIPYSDNPPVVPFSFAENVSNGGDYAIAIFDYGDSGSSNPDIRFNAFLDYGTFTEHPTRKYTITPPATDAEVLTVGAADVDDPRSNKQLRSYSSRGPTVDGRPGVDLIGPDGVQAGPYADLYSGFQGTSAAAPHVAGVAALVYADLEPAVNPAPTVSNIESRITGQTFAMDGAQNQIGAGHLEAQRATLPQAVTQGSAPPLVTSRNESSVSVSVTLRSPPTAGSSLTFAAVNASESVEVTDTVSTEPDKTAYNSTLDLTGHPDIRYNYTALVTDSTGQNSPRATTLTTLTANTERPDGTVTAGDTGVLNTSTASGVPVQVRFNKTMNTSAGPAVQVEGLSKSYAVSETDGWVNATTYEGQYSIPEGEEGTAEINVTTATDEVGNPINETDSGTVQVDTDAPEVVALDAEIGIRETNVTLTTDQQPESVTLNIDGPDVGTLTLADNLTLASTKDGNYTYETTYNTSNGGDYTVEVTTLADAAGNDGVAGQSDETIIAEEDKGTLTGTITGQATGDAMSNVTVELTPANNDTAAPEQATVYENGTYELRTATGKYDVSVTHDEGDYNANTTTSVVDLAVTNTTNVTLDPKPASLAGSVGPADGGNVSFEGTDVTVTDSDGNTVASTSLDANHEFSVTELTPEAYTVTVEPTDYATVTREITPAANESLSVTEQAATLPAEATGTVVDTVNDGAPYTATIEAVNNETGTVETRTTADSSSSYTLAFRPGKYDLRVVGPMYETNATTVSTASNGSVAASFALERVSEYAIANGVTAPSSAEVGDDVTLEATVVSAGENATNATVAFSVDGSEVATSEVSNLSPDQSETASVTYTVSESAADSTVSVTAATDDSTTSAKEIDVAALPDDSGDDGGSGGPTGGGGGGAAPAPAPAPPQPPDETNESEDTTLPKEAEVESVESRTATFDGVESVSAITFEESVDTNLTVEPSAPEEDEVPVGNDVVTGISAETDTDTSGVEREVLFSVAKSSVNADSLVVAHESNDGEWSALETTVTDGGDVYEVSATADSFSRFVVVEADADSENAAAVNGGSDGSESTDGSDGSDESLGDSTGDSGSETTDDADSQDGEGDNETDRETSGVPGATTSDGAPGFGVVVTLTALLSAVTAARVRS